MKPWVRIWTLACFILIVWTCIMYSPLNWKESKAFFWAAVIMAIIYAFTRRPK